MLEALEDRDKSTEATATRRGTLDDNGESDSEITFRDREVSDDEYASNEVIDTCTTLYNLVNPHIGHGTTRYGRISTLTLQSCSLII